MDTFPDNFIGDHFTSFEEEHRRTVEKEKRRLEDVRLEKERYEKEKEEEKKRRRAAREAIKKANELKKLKDEVNDMFVAKGEHKEHVLNQEIVEITGLHQKVPTIGAIGGILGQIMICFHTLFKHWTKDLDILNPKTVQNFLYLYIDSKMRSEKLIMQVGKEVEDFLLSLDKPL